MLRCYELAQHRCSGSSSGPRTTTRSLSELVRDLVLGAAEHARTLGFAPHPDSEQTRARLGPWAAAFFAAGFAVTRRPTRWIAVLTAQFGSDVLHIAYKKAENSM
jgi:hypothetical protein